MKIEIITADWKTYEQECKKIREIVFIKEQSVPIELEWDEFDSSCTHFLVSSNNVFIATARLKNNGQIGRMSVLKKYRRLGIGSKLLDYILDTARALNHQTVFLHSQSSVINFYRKKEFITRGKEFLDANISHQEMFKTF